MVDWVALWQAAKKGLSHSPYVTCFPSASAVRICYQSAPAGLGVLNSSHLTTTPFPFPTCQSLHISPTSLCPACVTCHMDVIADRRTLMHVESMAAHHTRTRPWQQAHINKTSTYSYVSITLSHSHVAVSLFFSEGRISEDIVFVLETGLGSDV